MTQLWLNDYYLAGPVDIPYCLYVAAVMHRAHLITYINSDRGMDKYNHQCFRRDVLVLGLPWCYFDGIHSMKIS